MPQYDPAADPVADPDHESLDAARARTISALEEQCPELAASADAEPEEVVPVIVKEELETPQLPPADPHALEVVRVEMRAHEDGELPVQGPLSLKPGDLGDLTIPAEWFDPSEKNRRLQDAALHFDSVVGGYLKRGSSAWFQHAQEYVMGQQLHAIMRVVTNIPEDFPGPGA